MTLGSRTVSIIVSAPASKDHRYPIIPLQCPMSSSACCLPPFPEGLPSPESHLWGKPLGLGALGKYPPINCVSVQKLRWEGHGGRVGKTIQQWKENP